MTTTVRPDDDPLADDLLRSAARLSRWASRHASFDVPFAQARLLATLDELGPARIGDLARADHTSQPTTTTQVDRLESADWAARTPDPADARACLVTLTTAGAGALERVRRARVEALRPALAALADDDRARLVTAVDTLHELLAAAEATRTPELPGKDR